MEAAGRGGWASWISCTCLWEADCCCWQCGESTPLATQDGTWRGGSGGGSAGQGYYAEEDDKAAAWTREEDALLLIRAGVGGAGDSVARSPGP